MLFLWALPQQTQRARYVLIEDHYASKAPSDGRDVCILAAIMFAMPRCALLFLCWAFDKALYCLIWSLLQNCFMFEDRLNMKQGQTILFAVRPRLGKSGCNPLTRCLHN